MRKDLTTLAAMHADLAMLLAWAYLPTDDDEYKCGEVIVLWVRPNGTRAYTYSYHLPHGLGIGNNYEDTTNYFGSEIEAHSAMADYVWAMNERLRGRQ